MKNTYIIIGIIIIVVILAFFFGSKDINTPVVVNEDESTNTLASGTYNINLEKSFINWSGDYMDASSVQGKVSLLGGFLSIVNGEPVSGSFDIDMQSIKSESYPASKFSITRVLPNPVVGTSTGKYIVDGRLTVKNIEQPISFPIEVKQVGNQIIITSSFALNRADWGVTIGNEEIKNPVSIELYIEAVKE